MVISVRGWVLAALACCTMLTCAPAVIAQSSRPTPQEIADEAISAFSAITEQATQEAEEFRAVVREVFMELAESFEGLIEERKLARANLKFQRVIGKARVAIGKQLSKIERRAVRRLIAAQADAETIVSVEQARAAAEQALNALLDEIQASLAEFLDDLRSNVI